MKKALLISDSNFIQYNENLIFFNVSGKSLIEILINLQNVEVDFIVIYAELKLFYGKRNDYLGIELLKHIRLTPELANINRKPILLLHWFDISFYIEKNRENIFLFSPGIYRKKLPVFDIQFDKFDEEECLDNGEILQEYLFNSENDEQLSAHHFRNQLAIEEFKTQSENKLISILEKPLWFKKLYYKSGYFHRTIGSSNLPITQALRILLIDDLAIQWKESLLMILPNASIEYCISKDEALDRINNLFLKKSNDRLEFNKLVEKFKKVIGIIEEKDKTIKDLVFSQKSIQQNINVSKKKIEESSNKIQLKTAEFNEFINSLMATGALLELMMTEQTLVERLNSNSGKEVDKLQKTVRFLLKEKNILESEKSQNCINETKFEVINSKIKSVQSELNISKQERASLITEIQIKYDRLIYNELDIILLDMHLSHKSEGKEINEMDGYEILEELKQNNLNIPVILFSATNKSKDVLYEQFPFLNKHYYLKGITPVSEFFKIINRLLRNTEINSIIGVIDEILAFPVYLSRFYHDYNSPDYDLIPMNRNNVEEVKKRFEDIKKLLNIYKSRMENTYLNSVLRELSNIQSNFRLRVLNPQQGFSLFSYSSLRYNKIRERCVQLNSLRNKDTHNEKIQVQLCDISTYLTTVYEGLIFDK